MGQSIEIAEIGSHEDADENTVRLTDFKGLNLLHNITLYTHYRPEEDEQLFEYSKLEANQTEPQKEVVAFRELVNDILIKYQLLAKEKGITLTMDAPARVPHVFADIALMERVVQNLLDNSLKFTEPGGEIMVMLRAG